MKIRKVRICVIYVFVFVLMAGFIFRLMRLQITQGSSYRAQSDKTTVQSTELVAPRGEIMDRYGRVLATNSVGYSLTLQKSAWPSDTQNANILKITELLSQDGEGWEDSLPIGHQTPWDFSGSDSQIGTLRQFVEQNLDGLPSSSKTKRNSKQDATYKTDEKASAADIMKRLIKRYKITGNYTNEQIRTLVGVRYQMEQQDFSYTSTYTFAKNLSLDSVNRISENGENIPGILVTQQYTRSYTSDSFAPFIVGNVGPIFSEEYNNKEDPSKSLKNQGYSMDDVIGRGGVESTMEKYLRGTNGSQSVLINKNKEIVGTEVEAAAQPGNNVVLTVDRDLQQAVQDELPVVIQQVRTAAGGSSQIGANANAGSAVVLNIRTGEVLAMASYPSYTRTQYTQSYSSLASNPAHPLLNRAIQGVYRPGSTYKPVTAIAGLMNGVITPTETVMTSSYWTKYGAHFYDDTPPSAKNVIQAISASSNYFFYTVADRLYTGGLLSKLEGTAKELGLGQKTGIELPGELSGEISGPTDTKNKGETWYPADAAQSGIGQLNNLYTPLQLAQYAGAIANGGTYYKAHIVKKVTSYDNTQTVLNDTAQVSSDSTKLSNSAIGIVKQGMLSVTEASEGTADSVFQGFPVTVAGKTGTAQTNNKQNYNGVFISFAPYDNPEIAVAVVIENGHNGYQTAPVARSAYNYYFANNQQWTTDALPNVSSPLPTASNSLIP